MKKSAALLLPWLVSLLAACGGGGGSTTGPTTPRISVGGQYATAVTLTEDTCGGTSNREIAEALGTAEGKPEKTL